MKNGVIKYAIAAAGKTKITSDLKPNAGMTKIRESKFIGRKILDPGKFDIEAAVNSFGGMVLVMSNKIAIVATPMLSDGRELAQTTIVVRSKVAEN